MCNMKRVLSLLVLQLSFFGLAVSAQTVSPIIVECGMKCRGEFSITNNGLTALAVTVEARSFSLDTLGHAFGYQLKCSVPPCSVALLSSMVVGHTAEGLLVRVQLAHTVYICEKQKDCRKKVRAAAGVTVD
jgi:hypothetical protein